MTRPARRSAPARCPKRRPRACASQAADARLGRIADFFFEAGMLRRTPRSGWPFLGQGKENVAEHSFRTAAMAFVLATLAGADPWRTCAMALFHDFHEARTADLNYVHQRYAEVDERRAMADALAGTGLEEVLAGLFDEFEARESPEAKIAKDADQLDLVFNLKAELDRGCAFAREWLASALQRLRTDEARSVAGAMLHVDHNRWWYGRVDRRWWVDRDARYRRDDPADALCRGWTAEGAGASGAPAAGRSPGRRSSSAVQSAGQAGQGKGARAARRPLRRA